MNAWLTLAGAVLGGVGLKVVEHLLGKKKVASDTATELRDEIRTDYKTCKQCLLEKQAEVDEWRNKFYEAYESVMSVCTSTCPAKSIFPSLLLDREDD